ncbi:MAG: site-specific DNA-methyltransferase, partial [Candidatus Marinimicrobia bacterium]|nr:site-specific DNA-methyltransferase [Candidatus Neomarinimicrobiota bacterium]
GRMTLQDYYAWNESWLKEAFRILKNTGSIYLFCGWRLSGMYHGLLSNKFKVQTRITWKNRRASQSSEQYRNEIGDIWFAAKTNSFLFRDENKSDKSGTNLWPEIFSDEMDEPIPNALHEKILRTNSFKLNWVLDPFMGKGSTGAAAKSLGRRFIGIDLDKDRVILSMKKIDQT